MPTPVKYDSHGTWESNNYHGLGWRARHDAMFPTPIRSDATVGKGVKVLLDIEDGKAFNQLAREVRKRQRVADGTWPTPITPGLRGGSGAPKDLNQRLGIRRASDTPRRIPTPTNQQIGHYGPKKHQVSLESVARAFPTTTAVNGLRGSSESEHFPNKWGSPGTEDYGDLNPMWVEWLMGWPYGWTSLQPIDGFEISYWQSQITQDAEGSVWWVDDPSGDGDVPRVCDKQSPNRIDRIAALGNGQVSAAAAAAFVMLDNLEPEDR